MKIRILKRGNGKFIVQRETKAFGIFRYWSPHFGYDTYGGDIYTEFNSAEEASLALETADHSIQSVEWEGFVQCPRS